MANANNCYFRSTEYPPKCQHLKSDCVLKVCFTGVARNHLKRPHHHTTSLQQQLEKKTVLTFLKIHEPFCKGQLPTSQPSNHLLTAHSLSGFQARSQSVISMIRYDIHYWWASGENNFAKGSFRKIKAYVRRGMRSCKTLEGEDGLRRDRRAMPIPLREFRTAICQSVCVCMCVCSMKNSH